MEEQESRTGRARNPDEKFCFACGTAIHQSATDCPSCGAAQTSRIHASANAETGQRAVITRANGHGLMVNHVFCRGCGETVHKAARACPHCGAPQSGIVSHAVVETQKSKTTAGILAIFLGGLGVHKFYLDEVGLGILYLIFCWTFIPAFVALIEGLVYLTMSDEHFARRYG